MSEEGKELKAESEPAHNERMSNSQSLTLSSKAGHILRIESQIRKLKQIVTMQNQLKKSKEQFDKINSQILQFEQRVKVQRKQAFRQKISQIQKRKHERQNKNKQTNNTLAKIKEQHRNRRKNMESLISLYKQEYEHVYRQALNKKRQGMKLDLEDIKVHQSEYIKSVEKRRPYRIKTENYHRDSNQSKLKIERNLHRYSPSTSSHDVDLEFKRQLARRRKQYGQNAQRQAVKIKVSLDMVKKAKTEKKTGGFDPNIDVYQNLKKKLAKPKLDTNFNGSVQTQQNKQIEKIVSEESPAKEKLTRLGNLAEGLMLKYDNGHDSALDKICNVNLLRAQIYLQEK